MKVKNCQCCDGPLDFMLDGVLQLLCYRCHHNMMPLRTPRDKVARIEYHAAEELTLP